MAGKGGGAWKVAYADFVTAMMAFFMVMWLVSQGDKNLKESVATYFRDPRGIFAEGGSLVEPNLDTFPDDISNGKDKGKDKNRSGSAKPSPKVQFAINRGERTRMGTAILFEEDPAEMSKEGRQKLDGIIMTGDPEFYDVTELAKVEWLKSRK